VDAFQIKKDKNNINKQTNTQTIGDTEFDIVQ